MIAFVLLQLAVGQRVATTAPVNVRSAPALTGALVGQQAAGAQGTVTALGVSAPAGGDTITRVQVAFDAPPSGWVWQAYLTPVTVVPPPSSSGTHVLVVPVGLLLTETDGRQLYAIVGHADGTFFTTVRRVKWSVDNPAIVRVDSTGWVRALAAGGATVTATDSASGASATTKISVFAAALSQVKQVQFENFALPAYTGTIGLTLADSLGRRVQRAICTVTP